jgi:hypothetical protein
MSSILVRWYQPYILCRLLQNFSFLLCSRPQSTEIEHKSFDRNFAVGDQNQKCQVFWCDGINRTFYVAYGKNSIFCSAHGLKALKLSINHLSEVLP